MKTVKISESSFRKLMESTAAEESGELDQPTFPIMRRSFAFKDDDE